MTDRERFEAWASDGMSLLMCDTMSGPAYCDRLTFHAYEAWQASRNQALGDAKDACFIHYLYGAGLSMEDVKFNQGVSDSIQAIDALANPEGEQG